MICFEEEVKNVYRLKVPFEDLYTSVFLIKSEAGNIIVDCATTDYDVDEVILPALAALGYSPSDVSALVITHNHKDHSGGKNRILYHAPNIRVISKKEEIDSDISIYEMPGHEKNFVGVYDKRTNTLISGDGLQGAGVGKYRAYFADKDGYLSTIERIRADKNIENLLFSHAYEPWYCDKAIGREAVLRTLSDCLDYVK